MQTYMQSDPESVAIRVRTALLQLPGKLCGALRWRGRKIQASGVKLRYTGPARFRFTTYTTTLSAASGSREIVCEMAHDS